MIVENWQGIPPDPAWVAAEIERLDAAVDEFAAAMKARFAEKAREGCRGWDDPAEAQTVYTDLLAHAAGIPLAAGQEVDIANFALMLRGFRKKREA